MEYIVGLISGFASGFFGAGGGLILLPALVYFLKLDEYKARGTTLASILVATLIASIFYAKYQYFDFQLSLKVALGGMIGGIIGAKLMKKLSPDVLSFIFHIFLIYLSIKMMIAG